jgi:hypothetical protein
LKEINKEKTDKGKDREENDRDIKKKSAFVEKSKGQKIMKMKDNQNNMKR